MWWFGKSQIGDVVSFFSKIRDSWHSLSAMSFRHCNIWAPYKLFKKCFHSPAAAAAAAAETTTDKWRMKTTSRSECGVSFCHMHWTFSVCLCSFFRHSKTMTTAAAQSMPVSHEENLNLVKSPLQISRSKRATFTFMQLYRSLTRIILDTQLENVNKHCARPSTTATHIWYIFCDCSPYGTLIVGRRDEHFVSSRELCVVHCVVRWRSKVSSFLF